jgi:sarcosine oxidase subunit gamma
MGRILSVAPYPGCEAAVADHLGGFPAPEETLAVGKGRLVWAGREQAFLFDAGDNDGDLSERLAGLAAVTDQSDGWAGLRLSGANAEEVLARLVPLDLALMPAGRSARSLLGHMPLLLIRDAAGFELWSFRSMAGTMLHEVGAAMRAVAARSA